MQKLHQENNPIHHISYFEVVARILFGMSEGPDAQLWEGDQSTSGKKATVKESKGSETPTSHAGLLVPLFVISGDLVRDLSAVVLDWCGRLGALMCGLVKFGWKALRPKVFGCKKKKGTKKKEESSIRTRDLEAGPEQPLGCRLT